MTEERRIAKIKTTMLGFEHGFFTASITFDYGDGTSQGLPGYNLRTGPAAAILIQGILHACGARSWEELPGRTVYAVIEGGLVRGLEPLPTEIGTRFMFSEMSDAA